MNELSIGWHDVIVFLGKPPFMLGDTPLSPIRILVILFAIKLALWISRFGEQTLRRLIQRRTTPLSEGSAYALGRIVRYAPARHMSLSDAGWCG